MCVLICMASLIFPPSPCPPAVNDEKILTRLEETFRRTASANGYLPQATFIREVIGDGVPEKLSEVSGCGCGGKCVVVTSLAAYSGGTTVAV